MLKPSDVALFQKRLDKKPPPKAEPKKSPESAKKPSKPSRKTDDDFPPEAA